MASNNWLAEIYSAERRNLFLTAWNILRHAEAAEDAVHAAFARMTKLREPPEDSRLYSFKAVRNAAIDMARAKSRRPIPEPLSEELQAVEVTQHDSSEFLEMGLARLNPEAREVVELHIHSSLSFREIAEIMGVPLQTTASRYRRALQTIRKVIEIEQNE